MDWIRSENMGFLRIDRPCKQPAVPELFDGCEPLAGVVAAHVAGSQVIAEQADGLADSGAGHEKIP